MRCPTHNVGGWLARRARLAGDRPAVIDAERRLDYAALEERCARLAAVLRAAGVGAGDRVALLLGNRSATLEAVFAVARLGAIAFPVNARLAAPEIRALLGDCTPRALLHEETLRDVAEAACRGAACAPAFRLAVGGTPDAYEEALAAATPWHDVAAVSPEDPMLLMYTSGTTGVSKGAVLPHRKTLFNSLNAALFFELTAGDRTLVVVPLFHSFGLGILSIPTLYAGGTVVLQPRFEPDAVWRAVEEERISLLGAVPTMFDALDEALSRAPGRFDLRSLRSLFSAGAAISVERIRSFHARGLVLKQGFGQTETSILCCLDARDALRKAGSVGRPVFHVDLRIVTPESVEAPTDAWRDATAGTPGEIVVRGPITMTGYWNRPGDTAETLRDGWLRTGDLGSFDEEGFVTLVGRARDMYISGGENVYPAEVEAVYRTHPAIEDVAIVGMPDPRWGETGCAFVVPAPGAAIDPRALRAFGAERLARYKLPQRFVAVSALPRTATGKVQKHRLPPPPDTDVCVPLTADPS